MPDGGSQNYTLKWDFSIKCRRRAEDLMQRRRRVFVPLTAFDEWEELAIALKVKNESAVRKELKGGEVFYSAPPRRLKFLKVARHFDGPECVYMPFSDGISPEPCSLNGEHMAAARAMCILAHGRPPEQASVARHLCGYGHRSCVNPMHLRWGSYEQNSHDKMLHRSRPNTWPRVPMALAEQIIEDNRMPTVMAIDYNLPAEIIKLIKAGQRSPRGYRYSRPNRKAAMSARKAAHDADLRDFW